MESPPTPTVRAPALDPTCEGLGLQRPGLLHPYIRLKAEFVYLAVILDGFSRKVVGWALTAVLPVLRTDIR